MDTIISKQIINIKCITLFVLISCDFIFILSVEETPQETPVYVDTLERLKDKKKETPVSRPISITLTPSVSTDSIVLLTTNEPSTTSHTPASSGRSTPTVSFNENVEIFEIPKREDLEFDSEELT